MSNVVSIKDALNAAATVTTEWPEPAPLPRCLPGVPPCTLDMLPTQLRVWAGDIAERLAVPLDFTAIPAMVAAGAMIGAKLAIRPQENTNWSETANLWGVIVAEPGALKTPSVSEVLSPIRRLDQRAAAAFDNEIAYFESQMAVHKMAKSEAEKRARKSVLDGDMQSAAEAMSVAGEPNQPLQRRHIITDATVEKLGEICADNPDGVLFFRDELLTQMAELDHDDKAAARGFFLSGWSGSMPYVFDRIGRGTVRIDRVNLSLLGTTQPDRIAEYLRESVDKRNDGLVQRLQLLSWPDMTNEWEDVDRVPNESARNDAFACYERLALLTSGEVGAEVDPFDDGKGVPFLRFAPDALERFRQYRAELEGLVRDKELPPAMSAHFAKYRGLVPRIALICHVASGGYGPVTNEALGMALEWAKYLEAHARRAYGSKPADSFHVAEAIWAKVEKGDLQNGFTEKDIYGKGWAKLGIGGGLHNGLDLLIENGWLRATTIATGGRPKTVYDVNPKALPAIAA